MKSTQTHTRTLYTDLATLCRIFAKSIQTILLLIGFSNHLHFEKSIIFFPLKMSNNYLTKINNNHPFPLPNVQVPRIIIFVNMCALVPLFVYHTCLNRIRATTTDCHIILFIKIFHRDNGNCRWITHNFLQLINIIDILTANRLPSNPNITINFPLRKCIRTLNKNSTYFFLSTKKELFLCRIFLLFIMEYLCERRS